MTHMMQLAVTIKGKKPSTVPLLGETYDLVTPDFKYIGEMNQLDKEGLKMACHAEAEGWEVNGGFDAYAEKLDPFKNGGSKMLKVDNVYDYKFKKFGDHITGSRPEIKIYNIIFRKMNSERFGKREFKNHTTGDYGTFEYISFLTHPEKPEGSFEGKIFNSKDELCYEIFGT